MRADLAAARDSTVGALAVYRRARILVRLGDAGAAPALSGFAATFPTDTAAPTALYVLADYLIAKKNYSREHRRDFGASLCFADIPTLGGFFTLLLLYRTYHGYDREWDAFFAGVGESWSRGSSI